MNREKQVLGWSRCALHSHVEPNLLRATDESNDGIPQYGAEMVESSVKSISRPVIDRLPVNQLDEFACRQLDRVSGCTVFYFDQFRFLSFLDGFDTRFSVLLFMFRTTSPGDSICISVSILAVVSL